VPRAAVAVRLAQREDLPAILCLWDEMREQSRARTAGRTPEQQRAAAEERYVVSMAHPDGRVVVAVDDSDGGVVGMAVLALGPLSGIVDTLTVVVSQMHVASAARHRGAGRALLAAAASFAEERGAEAVSVGVSPAARDSQRFYARLGFAPLVIRRAAPVAVLRRRLGTDAVPPPMPGVGEAVHTASRRGLRARAVTARAVANARRRSA